MKLTISGFLACLTIVAASLMLQHPRWSLTVDVGAEGAFLQVGETTRFQNFFGYHPPEQAQDGSERSFRWTSSELGAITFPAIQRMEPLIAEVVLCGCRFNGQTTPVTIELNNTPVLSLEATDEWRRYHIPVPPELSHPEYGVMLVVRADMWTAEDGSYRGVAVDEITVGQMQPMPLTDPLAVPALLVGLGMLAVWRRALLLPLLLTGSWLFINLFYQPHLLPRWLAATLLVGGLLALWSLVPVRAPPDAERGEWLDRVAGGSAAVVPLLLSTAIGVWLVFCVQALGHWVIDDAFISFRYAQNLVEGHGLVFNPGEYVEGYTNFLWTIFIAGSLLTGMEPVLTSTVLLLMLAFAIVMLTVVIGQRLMPAPWPWAAAALLVVNSPFLLYTARGSGMETALFTALILATVLALLAQRWLLAGLLTTLTLMTRPDGILLAGVAGLYALWQGWHGRDPAAARWRWLEPATRYSLMLLVLYVPYFLWRWSYYGYLLPNTFYVKVGSSEAQVWRGVDYLLDFAGSGPLLLFGVLGGLLGLALWRGRLQTRWSDVGLLAGLLALIVAYVVAVGGDWMPGMRFFIATLPLLALLGTWGLVGLAQQARPLLPVVVLVFVGVVGVQAVELPEDTSYARSPIWTQNYVVRRYREVGRWIDTNTPPDTWISTAVAGAMPYYANRPTIDILGLTDEHIAHLPVPELGSGRPGHEKTDLNYALRRRPEIIPYKGSDLFWGHPVFQENYDLQDFPGPEGHAVRLYVRYDVVLPDS